MGFIINYGSPSLFGILFIFLLVATASIVFVFLISAGKQAHDDIVEDIEDNGGDLKE